jgi:hypothetical protein
MVSFYMDHHVPSAITAGLRNRGIDVLTAAEDGSELLENESLLDRATALARVLFSQDEDLLAIAHERQQKGIDFAGIVYAHQLAISIGQAIRNLELVSKVLDPQDMVNRVEFIPYS